MNSEQDDVVRVMVDHEEARVSIALPGHDPISIPTSWVKVTTKVDDAGTAVVTLKVRADEFHVRPAAPREVTITDLPEPVTPQQQFDAQMRAIQRQAGY